MRYLCNISYNGLNFYGFERQKDKKTIQGEIERVLSKIFNEKIKITGCSRTDKGVHANNFYFHFDTKKEIMPNKLKKSINSVIDKNIYLKNISIADNNFHARYNVKEKEYVYKINTSFYNPITKDYILNYNKKLNLKLIRKASKYIVGKHNFRSFTSDNEKANYEREIKYIKIKREKDIVCIYICSTGFLKYMVRNIVGLLLDINESKKSIYEIDEIFEKKDRKCLGKPAGSEGLYLNKVKY